MEEGRVRRMADMVGCSMGTLLVKYLGLSVGGNPRSKSFWSMVIERVEKRLDGWSWKYLSLGGRLTLIRSVLMNLPTYHISIFQIPKGISRKLELCFRRFLWGDKQDKG